MYHSNKMKIIVKQFSNDVMKSLLKAIEDLPDVDAILVVYSVDDEKSFKEAVQNIQFIRQEMVSKQAIILVANKADLERRRVVSEKGNIFTGCFFEKAYFPL